MNADVRVSFPAFFRIDTTPAGRVHAGHVVLVPGLSASGSTPGQCTHKLVEQVQSAPSGPRLVRRLAAVPDDAEVSVATYTVPWKGRRVDVPLRLLRFELGGQAFACFPRVGAVVAVSAGLAADARHDATQAALDRWFRRAPRESDAEEEPWSDRRGDRVLWLDARVRAEWEGLDDEGGEELLRALFGQGKVIGAEELPKVARRLDALYPDRLMLDRVPDPRVETLRARIFEDESPLPTVLVGPSGSGKTTLVHAAIRRHLDRIHAEEPKKAHEQARLHHLDPNRVIAGMSRVGAWERRLVAILEHLVDPRRKRFREGLFVDQPLALARVGRSAGSTLTLTTVLRPWAERRRFPLILECTPEAWVRFEEMDRSFADLFHVVRVDEPPWDDAMERVLASVEEIERESGATLEISGLRRLAELQGRFPAARGLPGGMIDRLQLLAARHAGATVGPDQVDATFQGITGLRREIVEPTEPMPDGPLRARIAEKLVGQPRAVEALAELVHVLRAGLARPGKPLASWLLVGPTGVGKTEAAKVLAGLLFSSPDHLVRLDMNEYADPGAVARLLGDGHSEGHLPARLRRHTVAVLLLDEIEKAHPAVHDLLLQLLDEGRLTDASGRVLDLSRVAVLLTSNAGAGEIARGAGFEHRRASLEASYRAAVQRAFRPELVNRLDRILVFAPLALDDVRRVATLQIGRFLAREGFLRRTVLVDVDPAALDTLCLAGFDPELGARALKRVLEARLVAGVAETLASVPLDRPLILRIRPDGADVRVEAHLLSFAGRAPLPDDVYPTDEHFRALLDALPAAAFRAVADASGARVEGGHVLRLRAAIEGQLAEWELEEEGFEIADRHLARMVGRSRHFRGRHRPRWSAEPIDWMGVVSFRSVREFLLEAPLGRTWRADDRELSDYALLRMQVRAVVHGVDKLRVCFASAVTDDAGLWPRAVAYLDALATAIHRCSGDVTMYRRAPEGWRPDHLEDGERGARVWRVEGPGMGRFLRAEEGIHLFYPEDAAPLGLRVWLLPDGPAEDVEPPPLDTVVRLYVDGGEDQDLPTGLAMSGGRDELITSAWARRGGDG